MENVNQQMELAPGNQQGAAQGWAEGGNDQAVAPLVTKGPWNAEEDTALREMINVHGEGNWVAIATGLPGRTGKQCRERWINNLRPDLQQKNLWTEEEDRAFIEAHKVYGNRWSAIARCLEGRSHNSVKNHWSSTMRSLGAKRWVKNKKSGQVPFGKVTLLEEYILSLHETFAESEQLGVPDHHEVEAFLNTTDLPEATVPPSEVMHSGLIYPNVLAPSASYNPPEMGMQLMQGYHNAYSEPQVNDSLQQDINFEDPQGTNLNFDYPLSETLGCQSSNEGSSNVCYNEAGPSSIVVNAAPDDVDVMQMASMELFSPEYDVTLDPTEYI